MGQSPGILSWARCFFIAPFLGSHPHGWLPWTHASSKHAWESEKHKRICVTFPAVTTSLVPPQRAAMFPSLPISFLFGWNPAFFKSKSPSWLVCYCDKNSFKEKEFYLRSQSQVTIHQPREVRKTGALHLAAEHPQSRTERNARMHARMFACARPYFSVTESRNPCLENGAACGGLCLPTPITLIKTATFRHPTG